MTRYHLGCGTKYVKGYVNVDVPGRNGSVADIESDLLQLEMPVSSASEIYSHHVFEHFDYAESFELLMRWVMSLQVGGKLCISVPDTLRIAKELINSDDPVSFLGSIRALYGDQTTPYGFHKMGWSPSVLTRILIEMGMALKCLKKYGNFVNNIPNFGFELSMLKEREIEHNELALISSKYLELLR